MIFGEVMAMAMPEGEGTAPLGFFGGRFCRISD
jgi:hypothetical protein